MLGPSDAIGARDLLREHLRRSHVHRRKSRERVLGESRFNEVYFENNGTEKYVLRVNSCPWMLFDPRCSACTWQAYSEEML